jgi:hypothetical protein
MRATLMLAVLLSAGAAYGEPAQRPFNSTADDVLRNMRRDSDRVRESERISRESSAKMKAKATERLPQSKAAAESCIVTMLPMIVAGDPATEAGLVFDACRHHFADYASDLTTSRGGNLSSEAIDRIVAHWKTDLRPQIAAAITARRSAPASAPAPKPAIIIPAPRRDWI